MTDAGGFGSADPGRHLTEQERLLAKIADALNLPVSVFRGDRAPAASIGEGPTATECVAILAAFARIRDPDLRRQCLATVESCADAPV